MNAPSAQNNDKSRDCRACQRAHSAATATAAVANGRGSGYPSRTIVDIPRIRIGIVQARFNESITNSLTQACREELLALGVKAENIAHVTVPGAPCLSI